MSLSYEVKALNFSPAFGFTGIISSQVNAYLSGHACVITQTLKQRYSYARSLETFEPD